MSDRIAYKTNVAIIWRFPIISGGTRQTGKAATITVTVYDETNASFSTPTVTEPSLGGSGKGVYEFTFTPDTAGEWTVTMNETSLPVQTAWNFHVVATVDSDQFGTLITGVNVTAISGDTAAADALESILDGGGGTITANVTGNLSGSVGSVTGAVGSVTGNVGGNVVGSVASVVGAVGSVAAGGITAASIATDAIDSDAIAASAVTEIQSGLATSASIVTLQADTDDIQARLPATLVGGRMRSHVEAMDAGTITAAVVATDAIDADALAADAVAEIQSGLATSASIVTLQADTDDIQARLPATLSGGRMRSQVEGMDAGTVTAAAIATGAIDADALAADAGTEIGAAVDVTLTAAHGAGAWGGGSAPTVAQIVDGVLDEILAGHLDAGSVGEAISDAAAGGAGLTAQQVANAGLLTPVGVAAPGSLIGNLDEIMGPGFNAATDSLEEIRDEVDACCGASSGGDTVNVEGI